MPQLTLNQIKERASTNSFSRGEQYYRSGAIDNPVRRGDEIEATCEGSMPSPYRVRAVLRDSGIMNAACTCEYDFGGDCKHIVALLLTYLNNPEVFEERPPAEETLAQRSKEQLIALIGQMVDRYPDLQALIDRPVPSPERKTPVNVESFRRELRHAFRSYEGWGDNSIVSTIYSIAKTAAGFGVQGDWKNASAIYQVVLDECLVGDNLMQDEEGESIEALSAIIEGLEKCLDEPAISGNDSERRLVLNALLQAYIWNIDEGGFDIGGDASVEEVILKHARQGDIAFIRQQVTQAQKHKAASPYSNWGVSAYEDFLADLDTLDSVDPEVTLQRLRDKEMYDLLARRLLQIGRIAEAIETIREHITLPHERLSLLPAVAAAGQEDAALQLGEAWLREHYDDRLLVWLLAHYQSRHDHENVLRLQIQQMNAAPNHRYYVALQQTASLLGQWEKVRADMLKNLQQQKRFDVLTQVYLLEKDADSAWEALENISQVPRGVVDRFLYGYEPLDLQVAAQTREQRPTKALPVFLKHARRAIDERKRDSYARAAEYLSVAREIYLDLDEETEWLKYIRVLREEFKKMPALKDELNKAGLER